jgi:hypothetical protein
MAAGEFFELIRPVVLVLSAFLSTWVLASSLKRFTASISAAHALGTLLLPPVFFPIYLIARILKRQQPSIGPSFKKRLAVALCYLLVVLSLIGWFQYRETASVDAYLARATDAKVRGDRSGTIKEYRRALAIEDNAHIHKLLALELSESRRWTEALSEMRLAERGGEPDELIPYRLGVLLDQLDHPNRATLEYERFVNSTACLKELPDERCEGARLRISTMRNTQ